MLTPKAEPEYLLAYLSAFIEAEPGDTYDVRVSLIGRSSQPGFVECWNYDIGEVRNYAYAKIVRLTDLDSGEVYDSREIRAAFEPSG